MTAVRRRVKNSSFSRRRNSCLLNSASSFMPSGLVVLGGGLDPPNEMLEYFEIQSELFTRIGDLNAASKAQSKFIQLQKSVGSIHVGRTVMQIQGRFIERENLLKLKNQSRILDLQGEMIRRRNLLSMSLILVICLVLIIAFILFKVSSRRRQINEMLETKVRERTHELLQGRDVLRRSLDENQMMIENIRVIA